MQNQDSNKFYPKEESTLFYVWPDKSFWPPEERGQVPLVAFWLLGWEERVGSC